MLQQKDNILAPWTLLDNLYYNPKQLIVTEPNTINIDRKPIYVKKYLSNLDKSKLTTHGHRFLEHIQSGKPKEYAIKKLGWTQREYLISKYDFLEACGVTLERPPLPGVPKEIIIKRITLTPEQISKLSDRAKLFYDLVKKRFNRKTNRKGISYKFQTHDRTSVRNQNPCRKWITFYGYVLLYVFLFLKHWN
jgi:hypothetical protein